jgi:hypothetical protein
MSVLDSVIKLRALEQEQAQQNVETFIKGVTQAQEIAKTNMLADITQKGQMVDLAKSGLGLDPSGNIVANPVAIEALKQVKEADPLTQLIRANTLEKSEAEKVKRNVEARLQNPESMDAFENPDAWLQQFDQASQQNILDMVNYEQSAKDISNRTGVGRRQLEGLASMYAKAMGLNYTPAKAEQAYNYKLKFNDPESKTRTNIRSANVLTEHMNDYLTLSEKLPDTGNQATNQWVRSVSQLFGDPSITSVETAQNAIVDETERLLTQVGVTQMGKEHMLKIMNSKKGTKAQMRAFADTITGLMKGRLTEIGNEYKSIVGNDVPIDQLMSENTRNLIKNMELRKKYIEIRTTPKGKRLGKKADGTIEEIL